MKQLGAKMVVAVLLLGAASVWAQGGVVTTPGNGSGGGSAGCVNSPENPTALLAIAGAGGAAFSYARARRRARKDR